MSRGGFDRQTSIFSPEGNLYQVQYAFKAVSAPGLTTVAVRSRDGVVVATQHQVPDKLMRPETITSLYQLSNGIGCCVTGRAPDGRAVVQQARHEASEYKYKFGLPVPVSLLAKRMADKAQTKTQQAGIRPMGVTMTMIGMDTTDTGEAVPQIFKVDPAGSFIGFHAVATGAKEVEATAFLEKKQKQAPFHTITLDEAATIALLALQAVTGTTLKSSDVEMGRCSAQNPHFERVPDAQVELWLTAMAEAE
jgi:20S proteasome subunit alpha 1